jgi:acetoin:2,6-dichlorophenolindophenol oxidoreductase subunit alpha
VDRKELNIQLYRRLFLIREAEDAIRRDYHEDRMKTPMHMSTGEEAICAGVCQALASSDQVLGTYRSHGLYLAKTEETDQFFAELYGKATGMAKGKGGSMHLTAPAQGLICTSAIVATTIPVATGAAFANKCQGKGRIVAVFFGDGAIDEGAFWESLNAACAMELPVLFVCEDNGYAVHVPAEQRHGYKSITDIAERFNCDVFVTETTDAEQIFEISQKALASIRAYSRPVFLHLRYYRYLEHVGVNEDFNQKYRSRSELEPWLELDPVKLGREKLRQWLEEPQIVALEDEIRANVAASVKRAVEASYSSGTELYEDVLA